MPKTTVTFGEIMLRLSAPGSARLFQTPELVATFGGGEANVAVSLAGFGLPVSFVTILPEHNPLADAAIADLRKHGVDTSRIVRGTGRMGIYFLEVGANQRPSKVVYDRQGSSIALACRGSIDWKVAFEGASWFHITGITPALSECAAAASLEAVQQARVMGLTVSCDLNYRKNLWKWGQPPPKVMCELVRLIDVAIANEEDIQNSLGIEAADHVDVHAGALDPACYESLTNCVLKQFPNLQMIAVTMRESISASRNRWSACLNTGKEFLVSHVYDITDIVDRVGTGDSFAAGLIYGIQNLSCERETLEFAVAASCLKHSIPGDYNRVSVSDVTELLRNGGSGRVQR
jgi:2-dehydro-3-deoxygluconokinase